MNLNIDRAYRLKLPASLVALLAIGCGGGGSGSGGGNPTPLHSETVVATANFPTALRFLPDGRLLYTEKNTGNVRVVQANGTLTPTPYATVSVENAGERGLLGLAIDPDFNSNGFVYIFHTNSNGTTQSVVRFTDSGGVGTNPTVIVPNLGAANNHNGGRLAFGNDGKLYVTLGENGDPANSQNNGTPLGKVLRYNPDGTIPADNPIPGNPMFTKGHRNCFGLTVDPDSGTIYVSENGPSCDDEINRLVAGHNYGWRPGQPCNDNTPGFDQPIKRFPTVIAPTGITVGTGIHADSLFFGAVNDHALRRLHFTNLANGTIDAESVPYTHPTQSILDVTMGPDGNLYISTTDFGTSGQILRLVP